MQLMTCDDYKIALHKLQHQVVRDLAWCCFSPPMMNELPGSHANILPFDNQSIWPWLYALDQQPQALMEHLHQVKSTRLGIYYEALAFLFCESSAMGIVKTQSANRSEWCNPGSL